MSADEHDSTEGRRVFSEALRIREVVAAAEGGRADLQYELIVPLVRLGKLERQEGIPKVKRALALLEGLKVEGRLPKAEEWRIDYCQRGLAELEGL